MRTGRPKKDDAKRMTITIRISNELYNKIVAYADNHQISKTDVALQSLESFLSRKE